MVVGILALQGDFAEHKDALEALHVPVQYVRCPDDLQGLDALILPGGESTTMRKLLSATGLDEAIQGFNLPIFATCAGAILIAKEVTGKNAIDPLQLIDISIDRNAYGSQIQSFKATIDVAELDQSLPVHFIRAPIITRIGEGVEILSSHHDHPVLVRSGNILVATFHTEVTDDTRLHEYFLSTISSPVAA